MDLKGGEAGRKESVWRALAFTLLVPLGFLFLPRVGVPGAPESIGDYGVRLDLFTLGVMPLISASVVVELVALVVPSWSRLRNGGPAKRAKLGRAAFFVAVLLAASQAYGFAQALQNVAGSSRSGFSTLLVIATLIAGTMLLAVIADVATRRGLVSAYATLMIAEKGRELVPSRGEAPAASAVLVTIGAAAALAFATWLLLRKAGAPSRERDGGAASYRLKSEEQSVIAIDVPGPASGITPLFVSLSAARLLQQLFPSVVPKGLSASILSVAIVVVAAVALAFVFYRPARIAQLWRRAGVRVSLADLEGEARRRLNRAILVSLVFLSFVLVIDEVANRFGAPWSFFIAVVPATAIALDIVEAIRARRQIPDLVVVWPEQRPYAIAVARHALDAEGIPLVVANAAFRRIVPFTPFAPLDLMVPAASAKRARTILERTLGAEAEEADENAKSVSLGDRLAPDPSRDGAGKMAAMIVASVALAGISIAFQLHVEPALSKRGLVSPEVIQLVAVEDDADPLGAAAETSPSMPCLEFQVENVPVGPKKFAPRHLAVCKRLGNETSAVARDHLLSWLATVNVPKEEHFATGLEMRFDDDTATVSEVGARSYLLKREPILDANDVASAGARVLDTPNGLASQSAVVVIELTMAGAEKLERFTAANVGRRMAIVVEGRVESAPIILSRIPGGHLQITMGPATLEQQLAEAHRIEDVLMGRIHD